MKVEVRDAVLAKITERARLALLSYSFGRKDVDNVEIAFVEGIEIQVIISTADIPYFTTTQIMKDGTP